MRRLRAQGKSRYCNKKQTAAISGACKTDEPHFIRFCGFHAGMRYGEIDAARPEWFDLDAGVITISPDRLWKPVRGARRWWR